LTGIHGAIDRDYHSGSLAKVVGLALIEYKERLVQERMSIEKMCEAAARAYLQRQGVKAFSFEVHPYVNSNESRHIGWEGTPTKSWEGGTVYIDFMFDEFFIEHAHGDGRVIYADNAVDFIRDCGGFNV
jgi:hypothetical protein